MLKEFKQCITCKNRSECLAKRLNAQKCRNYIREVGVKPIYIEE